MDQYKATLDGMIRPTRSRGAQLLRDTALGHPEYPDPRSPPKTGFKYDYASHAADALAYSIDNSILNRLRHKTNAKTVK